MKKNLRYLFTGAGTLAVASIVAKLLGAMYRVPLTNVLGGEGMGLYQLVFPLYTLLLTVSSGGLPIAVSRLVAVKLADGDEKGAARVLRVSLVALSIAGLIGTALLLVFGGAAAAFQGNAEARIAYYGVAPAVLFVAIISCFRGYFQGRENMLPGAVSQLTEQAGKLVFGLYLANKFMSMGYAYGVFGALVGVSLSELFAAAVLALTYVFGARVRKRNAAYARRLLAAEPAADEAFLDLTQETVEERERRKIADEQTQSEIEEAERLAAQPATAVTKAADSEFTGDMTAEMCLGATEAGLQSSCREAKAPNAVTVREILGALLSVAVPVAFGSLVMPLTGLVDSVLVVNILQYVGYGRAEATAAYGLTSGTVATLVNVPVAVIFAFSAVLLPRVAKCCRDPEKVAREAGFSLKLCCACGLLCALALGTFSSGIVRVLYSRGLEEAQIETTVRLTRISAVSVLYVGIIQVSTAALQGLGEAKIPARNLLVGAIVKVAVTAVSLFFIGVYGAAIGTVLCYATTAVLDVAALVKRVPLLADSKILLAPVVGTIAFAAAGLSVAYGLSGFNPLLALFIEAAVATAAYIAAMLALKWFTRDELARVLPFIKRR